MVGVLVIVLHAWLCAVGVLASLNRESLPSANVPAVVPKDQACSTPDAPVMIGSPEVEPIAPALLMLPCVWLSGVRASLNRLSLPSQNVLAVVPNEPTPNTPEAPVMIGRFAVLPIAPALLIEPIADCVARLPRPVTPAAGRPVQFVSVPPDGVPR